VLTVIPLLNLYAHTRVHRIYLILFGIAIFLEAHTYHGYFHIQNVFNFAIIVRLQ